MTFVLLERTAIAFSGFQSTKLVICIMSVRFRETILLGTFAVTVNVPYGEIFN